MPVTNVARDTDALTLTITAQFAAPVERIWRVYADPRQLERVWGPPDYPATFVEHSLTPGGRMTYYMTAPDGTKYAGWWVVTGVDEPRSFTYDDGFANEDFTPAEGMPVSHTVATFEPHEGGTRAVFTSSYDTAEALQQVLDMGVEEGSTGAINQIDDLVAA